MLKVETFYDMIEEAERAIEKHGRDQYITSPRYSIAERFVILAEEVGEVAHELTYDADSNKADLRKELIQVATMAAAWAETL